MKIKFKENDGFCTLEGYGVINEVNANEQTAWVVEYDNDDQFVSEGWLTTNDVARRIREFDGSVLEVSFE